MSTLYVIGTPIGNLEDITLRAVSILKTVDVLLCEDTRVTKRLLARYEIKVPTLFSYSVRSSENDKEKILAFLREGKKVGLVTDAGTPGISDPGSKLVNDVRTALSEISIVAIPGASALSAALSISGFPSSEFMFLGFLPNKKGRQTAFQKIAAYGQTVVMYESPHRILKALDSLVENFKKDNTPLRRVAVGRELTKFYEEMFVGTAEDCRKFFLENPEKVRGEFVVVIEPR